MVRHRAEECGIGAYQNDKKIDSGMDAVQNIDTKRTCSEYMLGNSRTTAIE